ncbi:MAG: circularly permuted type 2 ATP-grasp protein [Zhengella sp.]|uniref:circularly permuted type 2 ATP-grasp protein n=1 Tax=Zhengella sp. TaxID=2282762 RepID=UPI0035282C2F|nr:circularly permuted type 2 ATP-grasp protein [Brucellaceae bacterium]
MMQASEALSDLDLAHLLGNYRLLPGIADELLDANGNVRPVWTSLLRHLASLDKESLDLALARANQYLKDGGVYFRHYDRKTSVEKEWPLSHIPLLIEKTEWDWIATALYARADLLEQMMADIYGPNHLVDEGYLPAEILTANPEWLRPAVGIEPRGGYFLHHIAFDIGRGPDGKWWVLGDRTQAPSGAGFALETRMATSRGFSQFMNETNVMRLAGFFRQFRDAMQNLCGGDARVGILTPGPLNDTYFEHAYVARYLGLPLLQGSDLTVRDGQLLMRTVSGLMPVDVLWRRLDSEWLDPLELQANSFIGTPGLLEALRAKSVTLINAPGTGVLESRAMMAFTPRIAEFLTGNQLAMPNIATWWSGTDEAREYVIGNHERMTIDDAMSTRLPFDHGDSVVIAGKTVDGSPVNPDWIRQNGAGLAAQEILSLSTTPALIEGKLVARPMSLRVFMVRTPDGWSVMPGGFARIGGSGVSTDIAMQRGGSVCDVWVVSDQVEQQDTLLTRSETGYRRSELGALPSTAADNLLWLGRYVERAEDQIRLLRAYHLRIAETGSEDYPLASSIASQLEFIGVEPEEPIPAGLIADLEATLKSAGNVRDRFSIDGWNALVDLMHTAREFQTRVTAGDDAGRAYSVLLRKISGFTGLVHENMYHFLGWRFLSIGRAIERALAMLRLLGDCTQDDAPIGSLELAIEVGDSVMTHRRRYTVSTDRDTVVDLLLLDEMNPRSVHYQFRALHEHASYLPHLDSRRMTEFQVRTTELVTSLSTVTAEDISLERILDLGTETGELNELISQTYLR